MKFIEKFNSYVIITLLFNTLCLYAQNNTTIPGNIEPVSEIFINSANTRNQVQIPISFLELTAAEWRARVDSVWGQGLPTSEKLRIFDAFWNRIDSSFACFHDIQDNWLSLKNQYRPEVAAGVSKGRFQAIMSVLAHSLTEIHTNPVDLSISGNTPIVAGTPILLFGGWGKNSQFGAALSPLPDSSLLVYRVMPNHPLGLEPGDVVLGYEGIPWRILVRQLLSYELPAIGTMGSSPGSYNYSLLMSAGRNRHLFETIDIIKYSTGDTIHLSTATLYGLPLVLNDDRLDIQGIPKPDSETTTWGYYPGTNIGYIYQKSWSANASAEFYNAVNALKNTDGLIIDFRYNVGGNMFLSDSALKVLFTSTIATIDWGTRTSPSNHTQLTAKNSWANYKIKGTPPGYLKPIAVLTGPGAGSSGDQVAYRMNFHPRVRIFGKPTNGAFNSPTTLNLHPDWRISYASSDARDLVTNKYLTHLESPVDEHVWLTRDGVAQGKDDVVESAVRWLNLFSNPGTNMFADNAESGMSKWTVTTGSWTTIRSNAHSPANSFTESVKGSYKNNANVSMTQLNSLNGSNNDAIVLSFWHKYATQLDKDYCLVEVSSNNGTTWQEAARYTGTTITTVHEARIDISKYVNSSANFKIRFRLIADASTVADGWYIDDISLTGYNYGSQNPLSLNGNNYPYSFSLLQNYPNPFNPSTKINYSLAADGMTAIKIYDILGREVQTLINENMKAGEHTIEWNAANYPSGIYFYTLKTNGYSETKKMILVK